jgi:hypothetical protein
MRRKRTFHAGQIWFAEDFVSIKKPIPRTATGFYISFSNLNPLKPLNPLY